MAERGQVNPDRNRNRTEVNTHTKKALSRSVTSGLNICPMKPDASTSGNMKGRYCHALP